MTRRALASPPPAGVMLLVPGTISAKTAGPLLRVLAPSPFWVDTYDMLIEVFPTRV